MSYGQGVRLQYCPSGGHLNFLLRGTPKIAKNGLFLLFSKLLEILILKHISRVRPCEASRPDDSENVVVFGPREFLNGSYRCSKLTNCEILGPLQKIRGVKKKRHGHNNEI